MSDPASIVSRIRAAGSHIEIDGGKLRIINGRRVPDELRAELRQHGKAVANWLVSEGSFEGRSAIMEHDGQMARHDADRMARLLFANCPAGTNPADWTWFVNKALEIMDAAPMERAA